jgi:hypothetical protein
MRALPYSYTCTYSYLQALSFKVARIDDTTNEETTSLKKTVESLLLEATFLKNKVELQVEFLEKADKRTTENRQRSDIVMVAHKSETAKLIADTVANAAEILNFKQGAMLTKLRDMTARFDMWITQAQTTEDKITQSSHKLQTLLLKYGEMTIQLIALEKGHVAYNQERLVWNRDMKSISQTANYTQEKVSTFGLGLGLGLGLVPP